MDNQQEYRELSELYSEGIGTRFGANVAGMRAKAGQAVGNFISGNKSTSPAQAAQNAKVQYAYNAASKNLINDLQKLNLLPKTPASSTATKQVQSALGSMVNQIQQQQPKQTPSATPAAQQQQPKQTPSATPAAPQQAPASQPAQSTQQPAQQTQQPAQTQTAAAPASPATTQTAPAATTTTQPAAQSNNTNVNLTAAQNLASSNDPRSIDKAINATTRALQTANKNDRNSIAQMLSNLQKQKAGLQQQEAEKQKAERDKKTQELKDTIKKRREMYSQQQKPNLPEQHSLNGRLFKEYFTL